MKPVASLLISADSLNCDSPLSPLPVDRDNFFRSASYITSAFANKDRVMCLVHHRGTQDCRGELIHPHFSDNISSLEIQALAHVQSHQDFPSARDLGNQSHDTLHPLDHLR
jgi:hypothetical protein